jgi:hypothetical protein
MILKIRVKIIFSDSNSIIYELQLKLTESKEMYQFKFGKIFDFKKEIVQGNDEYEDIEFDFYNMEKNDRILDMKIIVSGDNLTGEKHSGTEGKDIAILAITKHVLFQFYGKNSFKDAFYKYSVENGKILKAYKKFISSDKLEDKYLRIQLINENRQELEEKTESLFGFMTQYGYITGQLNDCKKQKPQKKFKVIKYYKPLEDIEEEENNKKIILDMDQFLKLYVNQ